MKSHYMIVIMLAIFMLLNISAVFPMERLKALERTDSGNPDSTSAGLAQAHNRTAPGELFTAVIAPDSTMVPERQPLRAEAEKTARANAKLIQPSAFFQFWHYYSEDDNAGSTFRTRIARPDVRGEINEYFSYRIVVEFAGSPQLLDAIGEVKLHPNLRFRFGQFKVPFSTGFLVSSNDLPFVNTELMQAVEPVRDRGVQISAALPAARLRLNAGIFNGAPMNENDKNKFKDVVLKGILSPVKPLELSLNYYHGRSNQAAGALEVKKYGGSIYCTLERLRFISEYIVSKTGILDQHGYYVGAGYASPLKAGPVQKIEPIVRYEIYNRDHNSANGEINRTTIGLNLYFHDRFNKFQINYQLNGERAARIRNNEIVTNLQINL